ncbi:kinesin-like protein KIF19 [Littorina saxatilis]|uniref:Kinesin-like protein n=1 Tax=Littorina saxatilis TaxID=31220 RepID=A0AAN9BVT9_9CAEN
MAVAVPESLKSNSRIGGGEQNFTVALRIRPLTEDEILQGAHPAAHKVEDNMLVLMDPAEDPDDILRVNRSREKQFVFDVTFDGNATQSDVYESTTKFLIDNVINGYNATVFAYGATGAGKTHTMLGTDEDPGIMVQALNDLFLEMERGSEDLAYKVTMSYLEIYNEMIRDLLTPSLGYLDLREDAKGNVQVAGISEVSARSTEEVMQMLVKGNRERTQESTAANAASSRSHAILQVTVQQRNRIRTTMQEIRTGKLFLIDLAGSERAANTHNRGKRMVEGAHINRSLLALGNCINALSDKNGPRYINYRDSKLTRLLKDALGGNCKTVMIAHISPASTQFEESRNTLVYADRAKHIKTKVRRNVTDVAYHIAQYTNIITELREEIMVLRNRLQDNGTRSHANIQAVQSEVLGSRLDMDRQELTRFKEQLLTSFKDQMELRRTLMELSNASMEVSLETSRNQLIVTEFEANQGRRRGELSNLDGDNRYLEDEKALELAGEDGRVDSEEVRVARDELKVLHDEKHKTQRVITTVQKELEVAQSKTRKLAEMIPMRVSGADQQEVVRLLCKVHQLEIENLESQSASLLRDFQIKKKDMVISRLFNNRSLIDDLIRRQRDLLDEHSVHCPKDLEDMYELYHQDREEMIRNGLEFSAISPLPDIPKPLPGLMYHPAVEGNPDVGEKVFTQSAKSQHARRSQVLSRLYRNDPPPDNGQGSPYPPPVAPSRQSKTSFEDREVIQTNTRSIAALAAKKRVRANGPVQDQNKSFASHTNPNGSSTYRPLYRPHPEGPPTTVAPTLTTSRLAQHDQLIDGGIAHEAIIFSDDNLSQNTLEKTSVHTDTSLPPLAPGADLAYRARKHDASENNRRRVGYSQQYAKTQARKNVRKNGQRYGEQDQAKKLYSDDNRSDAGRKGNTRNRYSNQAAVNGTVSDSSANSTPQTNGGTSKTSKKALPTIPQYRKGTISVTGHALPK